MTCCLCSIIFAIFFAFGKICVDFSYLFLSSRLIEVIYTLQHASARNIHVLCEMSPCAPGRPGVVVPPSPDYLPTNNLPKAPCIALNTTKRRRRSTESREATLGESTSDSASQAAYFTTNDHCKCRRRFLNVFKKNH